MKKTPTIRYGSNVFNTLSPLYTTQMSFTARELLGYERHTKYCDPIRACRLALEQLERKGFVTRKGRPAKFRITSAGTHGWERAYTKWGGTIR